MADALLHENAKLGPLMLSDVRFSDTTIGTGAYSRVVAVTVPVEAAAKKYATQDKTTLQTECELMNSLCHPNVVHFIGLFSDPPALVMERMLTSLHDLLAPEPLSFFTMELKRSVLHDVASGLAYLHGKSLIHRNLTAKNLLVDSKIIAKITDLGVARFSKANGTKATVASETINYMPPEALADSFKYDSSIDIFSFGIVTMFAIGEAFPSNPQEPAYYNDQDELVARTELERRNVFMEKVCAKLQVKNHPFISLIETCLHNKPEMRPNIGEVLDVLKGARKSARDDNNIERKKNELVQALLKQNKQPLNQNFGLVRHDLVTENADLLSCLQKIEEKEKKTQQHLEQVQQELDSSKELQRKEAEENMRLRQELELYKEMQRKEAENRALKCDGMQSGSVSSSQDTDGAKKSISVEGNTPVMRHIGMISYTEDLVDKIYRPIDDISTAWEDIARQLKIDEAKIQNEKKKNQDATASANEMMRIWLGSDLRPTWSKLIRAMKVKKDLANAVKKLKTALVNMMKDSDDEEN